MKTMMAFAVIVLLALMTGESRGRQRKSKAAPWCQTNDKELFNLRHHPRRSKM
jgi:hypothetical protein